MQFPKVKQTTLIIHPPTVKQLNAEEYWSSVYLIFLVYFRNGFLFQFESVTRFSFAPNFCKLEASPWKWEQCSTVLNTIIIISTYVF